MINRRLFLQGVAVGVTFVALARFWRVEPNPVQGAGAPPLPLLTIPFFVAASPPATQSAQKQTHSAFLPVVTK